MSYIVSIVAVVLAALFAVLGKWWGGFAYFVLAILVLLSIFWSVWLILKYRTDFKKETEEKYRLYKARQINKLQISEAMYMQNEATYKKDFKRKTFKDRFIKWSCIAFAIACAILFLLGIILYK